MVQLTYLLTSTLPLLATALPSALSPRGLSSGSLTWYTEGLSSGNPTACGTVHAVTDHIAAISPADYGTYANPNNSPVCGKKIRVHGPNGKSVVVKVADRCAGCAAGDVDVTPVAFKGLGYATSVGRVAVSWEWAE